MDKLSLLVLAAGKGTRFIPFTNTTPKPLLKVAGESALYRNLRNAAPFVSEIVLVVGVHQDKIRTEIGNSFGGVPVRYVEQNEQLGTGHGVNVALNHLQNERFIVMYGDDLYKQDLFDSLVRVNLGAIGMKQKNWQNFGVFQLKDNSPNLKAIIEKPREFVGDLANIGLYLLNKKIFDYFSQINRSPRGELEFTDMVTLFARDHEIEIIEATSGWVPLGYPWDLLSATDQLLQDITPNNSGQIEDFTTIKGNVVLGKNSVIKSGAYVEGNFIIGDDCVIGPNCYLKGFGAIGQRCVVGNGVEICRSILGDDVNVRHLSYIGDSILGNNVNIGGGTMTANLKHNQSNIRVQINGSLVDSGRNKLGALIGDNAKTGVGTLILPGRKIYNDAWTKPGEVVEEDQMSSISQQE